MAKDTEESILTPVEIEHQTFEPQSFGGYNTHEVDQFLRKVVRSFEKILSENAELKERLEYLGEKIYGYQKLEESLREAYISAQNVSGDFVSLRKQEAQMLVEEARKEADSIRSGAIREKEKIEKEITELVEKRENIPLDELRNLARACLDVLDERKKRK